MTFRVRCGKCGEAHYSDEEHACAQKPIPDHPAPKRLEADEIDSANSYERDRKRRWREKNRERYNAYMREYREGRAVKVHDA